VNSPAIAQERRLVPAFLRPLIARFEGLFHEIGKFGVVGAVCYSIDIGIFNLLRVVMGEPIVPKIVSTVVAATVAFAGNRFWTWRHRPHSGLAREYPLFFGANLVGLAISVACLWTSHNWLGTYWPVLTSQLADNISGNVVGVGLASLFRFWAYRRFVFPVDGSAAIAATEERSAGAKR
jgi:putative flippase GtrA